MYTAKVLTLTTVYGYDPIQSEQWEVEVKVNGNIIGTFDGEYDWDVVYDWAVYEIDWVGNGERAGYTDSVEIGHEHAYGIAEAVRRAVA